MTRSFHAVSSLDIPSSGDGSLRGKDKTTLGTFLIKKSPSGRKYLICTLENYCIISDAEYKEYKQLKKTYE
jgi:hypothetical protein